MTPHLHPRSRLTSSLFGTTLAVSFLVVTLPHIVPCPAPRVQFADSELELVQGRKQRRTLARSSSKAPVEFTEISVSEEEVAAMQRAAHECPVPKPYGVIQKIMGFTASDTAQVQPNEKEALSKRSPASSSSDEDN